jgi:uncharacterized protein (DUF2141 family)
VDFTTSGASAPFVLSNLQPATYYVVAAKDVDGNGTFGPGDYLTILLDSAGNARGVTGETSGQRRRQR